MHIAMVTDYYLPTLGGVQTVVKAHKEALEQAGHTVTVFCPRHAPSENTPTEENDPHVVTLPTSRRFHPDNYPFTWPLEDTRKQLVGEFRERAVDVVHVHSEIFAAIAGLTAARSLAIPTVQTMHGRIDVYTAHVLPVPAVSTFVLAQLHRRHIPHSLKVRRSSAYTSTIIARRMWQLMVNQANYADHVVVPSQHFARKLLAQGVTRPLTVISNGLEESVTKTIDDTNTRSLAPGEQIRIMWCGRVSPEKRPIEFIWAIAQFPANVHVDMYGNGVQFTKVRRLIKRLGLDDRVTMHGAVPQHDILAAMASSHLFVSTSYDFDNQPMVMLEAIATGLPILYCDPDLTEIMPPGSAILADSPVAVDISAAVRQVAHDPSIIEHMSKNMLSEPHVAAQKTHLASLTAVYAQLTGLPANPLAEITEPEPVPESKPRRKKKKKRKKKV
ncbi:glycosyltransferase [Jonesia quinghaiensis]|uniref:glycosyltransferase n=1 Tax=Jonesia quinghaiensis TaxID=262806 RepID=UPI0004009350|nr:glycosyltransferase [Jonesia quinghaiensis]